MAVVATRITTGARRSALSPEDPSALLFPRRGQLLDPGLDHLVELPPRPAFGGDPLGVAEGDRRDLVAVLLEVRRHLREQEQPLAVALEEIVRVDDPVLDDP